MPRKLALAALALSSRTAAGFLESSGEDHPRRVEHSFDTRLPWSLVQLSHGTLPYSDVTCIMPNLHQLHLLPKEAEGGKPKLRSPHHRCPVCPHVPCSHIFFLHRAYQIAQRSRIMENRLRLAAQGSELLREAGEATQEEKRRSFAFSLHGLL